jgi:hypothetical protein
LLCHIFAASHYADAAAADAVLLMLMLMSHFRHYYATPLIRHYAATLS